MSDGTPMDCNEVVELVTAYLDGALDLHTRARFDIHLTECDGCDNYLQQLQTTVDVLGKVRGDDIEPAFRDRLMTAFRDWR